MNKKPLILLTLLFTLTSCAVSTTNTVATTPSINTGKANEIRGDSAELPTTVALLPFINKTESEFAFDVVRQTMFNHFASKNYRILHWKDVDQRLAIAGITNDEALRQNSPAQIAKILSVDGLIYGDVTHYDKTFAGIYAQVAVGVDLKFVKPDGTMIWQVTDVKRSHAGGISTTPVGIIMNALLSAKHIYGDINLFRAADELGRELASKMPEPARINQRNKPRITDLVHSGVGQHLKFGDVIEIAMEADAGLTAAAVVDGLVIDLNETSPGQYSGKLVITPQQNIRDMVLTGRLQDDFAQTSSWVSPYGLVNVDNIAPASAGNIVAQPGQSQVLLDWDSGTEDDLSGYEIRLAKTETGDIYRTETSSNSELLLKDLANFETIYAFVSALDKAGNRAKAKPIAIAAAPDSRFATAKLIGQELPKTIHGSFKMTAKNSPYYLRHKSLLATDGVLLIEPGTEIRVAANAKLTVLGQLHGFGETDNMIRVSGINDQEFNEFLLVQSKQSSSLAGIEIKNAGIPIQITAGSIQIDQAKLINCRFNCLTISGSARPTISKSLLAGAQTSGVLISDQAQPIFKNNQFVDNQPFHIQNGSTYQIDATKNQWQPAASNMTILGEVKF